MRDLVQVVAAHGVEHVVVRASGATDAELLPLLRRCAAWGRPASLAARFFDLMNALPGYEAVGRVAE